MHTTVFGATLKRTVASINDIHSCPIAHQSEIGMQKCTALDVINFFQSFHGIPNSAVFLLNVNFNSLFIIKCKLLCINTYH